MATLKELQDKCDTARAVWMEDYVQGSISESISWSAVWDTKKELVEYKKDAK